MKYKNGCDYESEVIFLDLQDEFYHYGIPGMKWGIRRTPAQLGHKLEKRREEGLLQNEKYWGKKVARHKRISEKASAKGQPTKAKIHARKAKDFESYWKTVDNRVKNMTLDDFKAEDRAVGKRVARSVLITAGSHALMVAGVTPIGMVSIPRVGTVRQNRRLKGS